METPLLPHPLREMGPPRFELGSPPPQGGRMPSYPTAPQLSASLCPISIEGHNIVYELNMAQNHPAAAVSFYPKVIEYFLNFLGCGFSVFSFADQVDSADKCVVFGCYGSAAGETSYRHHHLNHLYDFCLRFLAPLPRGSFGSLRLTSLTSNVLSYSLNSLSISGSLK